MCLIHEFDRYLYAWFSIGAHLKYIPHSRDPIYILKTKKFSGVLELFSVQNYS